MLLLLAGCGAPGAPPVQRPPVLAPWPPGPPYTAQQHPACRDGNRNGLWADDCTQEHCLPGVDLQMVYSVNLGRLVAFSLVPLPLYGATHETTDGSCGTEPPWRVWRLSPNTDYTFKNGLLYMVDPVRFCVGSACSQVVYQGWVVDPANATLKLYFPDEVFSSEITTTQRTP